MVAGLIGGAEVSIVVRAVDKFSRTFKSLGAQIRQVGLAAGLLGGALAVGLGFAVKQAIDFETAFTGVRKTVDLTEKEFEELEKRFKTLSTEIPVSFVELSRIGEVAGQLGISGVDNLEKFTETIAGIGRITNLSSEEAAQSFARIAAVMQEPIENIDRMASVVVELGNNFETSEREIVEFATRIAGVGNIVGLTTANILSIATAFTSVGVQAEAGGTAVQKVLLALNKAVVESDDNLFVFAKTAGLAIDDFKELFERDAIAAFDKFVAGLGQAGDDAINILSELGLEDQRLVRAFLSLAGTGDKLNQTIVAGTQEWVTNTAAVEETNKAYATAQSQIDILKNKIKLLGAEFGEQLVPTILDVIDFGINPLIDFFSELDDKQKDIIVTVTAVTAAVLGLTVVTAFLAGLVGGLAVLFAILATGVLIGLFVVAVKDSENSIRKLIIIGTVLERTFFNIFNNLIAIVEFWANITIEAINGIIAGINAVGGVLPGFKDIGDIPSVNFGRIPLPDIQDRLAARDLSQLEEQLGMNIDPSLFEQQFGQSFASQRDLVDAIREALNTQTIIIQIDGVEVARALQSNLSNQTNTA